MWLTKYPKYHNSSYSLIFRKKSNQKWAEDLNTYISPRRHTNSQQAHEKMPNLTNYKRKANQNHNDLSPHTGQNDHH